MYQKSLLKSIIAYRDAGAVNKLQTKQKILFTDQNTLALFKAISKLTHKYNEVPDKTFLQEYFKLEKNSKAKNTYQDIIQDKEIEVSDNIKGLIDQQITFIVKKQALEAISDYSTELKLSNGSDIKKNIEALLDEVASITKTLEQDLDTECLMYYDKDSDTENFIKQKIQSEYNLRKQGTKGYYKFDLGFAQIDQVTGGVHSVDFIGILGFVKNGKSFLARQIAYNILCQGKNVVFLTLEMSFESIQHAMLSLHANNVQYWGYDSIKVKTADIRSGTLTQKAEDFFINQVIDDFTTNPDMGSLYIKQPTKDYTPALLFSDIKQIQNNIMTIDALVIDYPSLMKPSSGYRDRESYNELFRELRHFGLIQGIPIIFPIQSNRAGYDAACKDKNNLFSPDAISDFSSIEREATHIFSIITTAEMRQSGQSQVQHLLSRESSLCPPIRINSDFETGTMTALNTISKDDVETMVEEINI